MRSEGGDPTLKGDATGKRPRILPNVDDQREWLALMETTDNEGWESALSAGKCSP
jgi:hypothetical protein